VAFRVSGPVKRARGLAESVFAVARRRRDSRKPRVRVRVAHGETRVLTEGDATRERLLSLASDLVGEYRKGARGA
jgi:hypothetical protein